MVDGEAPLLPLSSHSDGQAATHHLCLRSSGMPATAWPLPENTGQHVKPFEIPRLPCPWDAGSTEPRSQNGTQCPMHVGEQLLGTRQCLDNWDPSYGS